MGSGGILNIVVHQTAKSLLPHESENTEVFVETAHNLAASSEILALSTARNFRESGCHEFLLQVLWVGCVELSQRINIIIWTV